MSEMAVYQPPQQVSLVDYQERAVQRLADWAQSASAAYEVSRRLVSTSFCPVAYRGKPEEATAAILSGLEVGLSPMAALRAFDVIQGQAAPRAITLRAIAQSQGHEMKLVESTATRCRMSGRRKGETDWQHITWTLDRAKDLGLLGKDPWKKQPQAMLLARATSELARLIAADAILGIAYSAEELEDGTEPRPALAVVTETPSATPGSRRMSRRPSPAPEAPAEEAPPADEPEHRPLTKDQLTALHTLLGKLGYGSTEEDRAAKLDLVNGILGTELESSKDLSVEQASIVIDELVERVSANERGEL